MNEITANIKCIAVIRGSNKSAVRVAVLDLDRHAHLILTGVPKECDPAFADNVLIGVMGEPLKKRCNAAAVVALEDEPSTAIARILKIRAPAHVVVVTPDHGIFDNVLKDMELMPELDMTLKKKKERTPGGKKSVYKKEVVTGGQRET